MEAPTPKSILRGHKAQVHAAAFIRGNERLVTGDADGWIVLWDLVTMRPTAVWRAHEKSVLAVKAWGERIITHGRDNELSIWKLSPADEATLSRHLLLQEKAPSRPKPWLEVVMPVNSMNFCAFASCAVTPAQSLDNAEAIWLAVPNALQLEGVDLFHLPSQTRRHTVKVVDHAGMVMAVSLCHVNSQLTLATGYENGQSTVTRLDASSGTWNLVYSFSAHSQPILSLEISPCATFFITSSADAVIAKHPIPGPEISGVVTEAVKVVNTKHAGQQGLSIRSDGKVFATGGWDGRARVYSGKTGKEVAVLKWHEVGCFTTAFAEVGRQMGTETGEVEAGRGEEQDEGTWKEMGEGLEKEVSRKEGTVGTVKERRVKQAREGHWIAVGSKDGRVSLWDLF